ncbi:MAG: NfeD family protein [Desulfobulbaceae bacterium]|nr:NfeD family protein [Desulfobulbaceae bacterium]
MLPSMPPALVWFLLGIVFFVLELMLPGLLLFFFGLGAWCVALAVLLLPLSLNIQILIFLLVSVIALVLLRSTFRKMFKGKVFEVDELDDFVPQGAIAEVVEDIVPPAGGRIRYGGTFWHAVAEQPLARGTKVRVLAKNNLIITVEPTTQGEL